MNIEDVIQSQAFQAINLLIDQKAAELKGYMDGFRMRVNDLYDKPEYPAYVRTRIYEESPKSSGREIPLPVHPHQFKDLQFYLDTVQRLDREINELQQFKCRLTGDWDFCKGNLSDMKAVFGEVIEGMVEEN